MIKIITGEVENYGKVENTFFQVFYPKQKYITRPKRLNLLSHRKFDEYFNLISQEEYDNTYTISTQYPETEVCYKDSVVLFFWEATKSLEDAILSYTTELITSFLEDNNLLLSDTSCVASSK